MRYRRKTSAVDAFRFGNDAEVDAPQWFVKAVDEEIIHIDRCINDGAVRIYGCTIQTKYGRLQAKQGDYIIREKNGDIFPCREREFKRLYERV